MSDDKNSGMTDLRKVLCMIFFKMIEKLHWNYLLIKPKYFSSGMETLCWHKLLEEWRNKTICVSERPTLDSQLITISLAIKKLTGDIGYLLLLANDYSICFIFVHPTNWVGIKRREEVGEKWLFRYKQKYFT